MLSQKQLKDRYTYHPETGLFTSNIVSTKHQIGDIAGCINKKGYVVIKCYGYTQKAHRLAFLYMNGEFPKLDVDHINGIKSDNRWENLRDVTKSVNLQNQRKPQVINKLGLLGVNEQAGRYKAQICINGKKKHIGMYSTPQEAHNAYMHYKIFTLGEKVFPTL